MQQTNTDFADAEKIAKGVMAEIGTSGLNVFDGYIQETYTPELQWPGAYKIFNDMRRRVPTLRALLNAILMLSKQVSWKFESAVDGGVDEEAKDFGDSVLDDMGAGFGQAVEDALSALVFGWSWQEPNYARRLPGWRASKEDDWESNYDDGRIGLRSIAYRRQSSWNRWAVTDTTGRLTGMYQDDPPNPLKLLPLKLPTGLVKGIHFVPFRDGDNPEGWPLLESSYEAYYYLKNYSLILGVGMERSLVGWPIISLESNPSPTDIGRVERMVGTLLAGSEKGFLTEPQGVKLRFETIGNPNSAGLLDIMKYYNILMLQTTLADFISLGSGDTGSWSLGSDKSDLFLMAVNGVLDTYAETLNNGLVKQLFKLNEFSGLEERPRLVHTGIRKPIPLGDLGSFVSTISSIIPLSDDDKLSIRAATKGLLSKENAVQDEPEIPEIPPELLAGLPLDELPPLPGLEEEPPANLQMWLSRYRNLNTSMQEEVRHDLGLS